MISISIKNSQVYTGTSLVSGGSMQGALYYNNEIFQFGDKGYCQVLDSETLAKKRTFRLPEYADNAGVYPHCSSVEWVVPGSKLACTTNDTGKVAFADRFYIYNISDEENITQEIVMMSNCTDRTKYARMACMAFDTTTNTMYVAGYTSGSSKIATSPCWFESYDFTDYLTNGTLAATLIRQTESNGPGLHLLDGGFYNGYIYYLCDNSDTTNSSYDGLYFWVLDKNFNTITIVDIFPGCTWEAEAFAIIPGEHYITLLSSTFKNGVTYYKTRVGVPEEEPTLPAGKIYTSVNIIGYQVDGDIAAIDEDGAITLTEGMHSVTPIIKDGAIWNRWSDDDETQTRTITATAENPIELTAYAVRETVYLTGTPAPISLTNRGTSINAQGALAPLYFIVSSNTSYPNEYMLCSDGKYNDDDQDIKVLGSDKFSSTETNYFTENNIEYGTYYWTAIPKGYDKIKVVIYTGTGEDNTPNSRNPQVIITDGPTPESQMKIYGNTDVYRPIDATILTENGFIFDLTNIRVKDGTYKSLTRRDYGFVTVRLVGNTARLNDSYATITFMKTLPTT